MPHFINLSLIKKAMRAKRITQRELAMRLRIKESSIYRKLNGKTQFTANQIGEFLDILELDPSELYGYQKDSVKEVIF